MTFCELSYNYGPSDINFFQGCLHEMFLVSKAARNGVKHGTDCRVLYSSLSFMETHK